MTRRVVLLPLLLLVGQNGCASRGAGWEAGMMAAMVAGGLVVGGGMMHRPRRGDWDAAAIERFQPARLLEQRDLLSLTEEQVSWLEALRADALAGRRTPEEAARAAFDTLLPGQRGAVVPPVPPADGHHS